MKRFIAALGGLFFALIAHGQNADWVDQMNDPNGNIYSAKQAFDAYWEGKEIEKGKGHKQFMRWYSFWEPRLYPEGYKPQPQVYSQAIAEAQATAEVTNLGQWKPMGPFDGSNIGSTMGIGRINVVRFHPNNNQIVFAGAPAGGLWRSYDGGTTWATNTDLLPNLGVSDIAFNPLNPDVVYLATGDRNAGDTYSYGVLKSTDGGLTWKPTDLSLDVTFEVRVQNIYVSPADTSVVIAATRAGIYRSTDGGATFPRIKSGSFNGLVQKIGNPNVIFSSSLTGSSRIYRSDDMGLTWNLIADPTLPTSNSSRIELAVTADDTNYVYAVIGASNYGLEGVYRSTDGGNSWSVINNGSPNLLGWNTNGSDAGGQAWYDLSIAANPANKNEVFVGGVNIWRTGNGGNTWNLAAHWFGGGGAPFVHADIHHLIYQPITNHLYASTDGGVYRDKPNQTSWDELNDGMNITQYYKLSAGVSDTNLMFAGAQDNGSHRYRNGAWSVRRGGDGMDNAINPKNTNIIYSASQYGNYGKSTNQGGNFNAPFNLPAGVNGNGGWVTPIALDPNHPDTLYIGYSRLYRSFNGGLSFTAVTGNSGSTGPDIDVITVAPNHSETVYYSEANNMWRSDDRGDTWVNLSNQIPGGRSITAIAVDYDRSDHVLITRSGFNANQKIYESFNGGQTWVNISSGLPNVPANTVIFQDNPEKGIYVGTDLGVYYRDSVNPKWISFNAGLPNVVIDELEINYHNRKLRAATYGRGIWQTPLFSDLTPPQSRAEYPNVVCAGDTIQLIDRSDYNPNSHQWYIEPNTYNFVMGSSDTTASPMLVFNQTGIYDISLVTENPIGKDSAHFVSAIAAGGLPIPYISSLALEADFSKWEFESTSPGWALTTTSLGNSFKATLHNNTSLGDRYTLTSPALNLTAHDSAKLSFSYAYSGTSANAGDSLLVYAAGSCSNNWVLVGALGEDGSNNFVTASPTNSAFNPASSDWCDNGLANCMSLDLSAFSGLEGVRIRFVAVNANGNDLYLDNIEVVADPTSLPSADFGSQKQVCALDSIRFTDKSYGSPSTYEWQFIGTTTLFSSDRNPTVYFTEAGMYDVTLKVTNAIGSDSLYQAAHVMVNPADSVLAQLQNQIDTICAGEDYPVTLNLANAGANPNIRWHLNGQLVATTNNNSFVFSKLVDGDQIEAEVRSSLACAFPDVAVTSSIRVNTYPNINPQVNVPSLMCESDSALILVGVPAGGTFTGNGVSNGVFDPSLAGRGSHAVRYDVSGPNGCNYSTITYVGIAKPVALSTTGTTPIACEDGNSIALTVGRPAGGQYSGPGVFNNRFYPDSVAGVGSYALTYSYFSSICGTSSIGFSATVTPAPAQPGIIKNGNFLECDVVASSYQWYDANGPIAGATAKIYTPTMDGQYRVEISNNRGCASISNAVGFFIGLKDLPVGFEFSLYPNPTDGILNLDLQALANYDLKLSIYDKVGNLVVSHQLKLEGQLSESFDLTQLAAGVYLFSLEGSEINILQKVIVQ